MTNVEKQIIFDTYTEYQKTAENSQLPILKEKAAHKATALFFLMDTLKILDDYYRYEANK